MNAKPRAPSPDLIRILLVEENEQVHRLLCDLLDAVPSMRFQMTWSKTWQQGLDHLQHGRFDACLLSADLSDGDGLELLTSVEARGLSMSIVVLSSDERTATDDRALALGATTCLDKERLDAKSLERAIRFGIRQRRLTEGLARGSLTDEATGLASGSLYRDRLDRAIALAKRHDRHVAVIMIDLALGPAVDGESIDGQLRRVGRRLSDVLRESDTIARLAGGRLALLIEGMSRPERAALVSRRMLRLLTDQATQDERTHMFTPSIGIAIYPSEGVDGDTLLRRADAAVLRAIAEGGGRCHFASERIEHQARENAFFEKALRDAIKRRDLRLRFHPEMYLRRQGAGLATEVFWRHPGDGWLPLDRAWTRLTDQSQISEVMDWTISAAAERLEAWQQVGLEQTTLSIAYPIHRSSILPLLTDLVRDRILARGIPAERLEIDLPEQQALAANGSNGRDLSDLKATGVRVAIDGFGGHPLRIQDLRLDLVDGLKLAPSLYQLLPGNKQKEALLRAMISFIHDLDLRVTAKHAEDQRQFALLKKLGCDVVQLRGLFPPMGVDAATSWLRAPQNADSGESIDRLATSPEFLVAPKAREARPQTERQPPMTPN
jgi:diguanylate cyclase (GGDEF)-like protein